MADPHIVSQESPHAVVTRIRSAALNLAATAVAGLSAPEGPLRLGLLRTARENVDRCGRKTFFAERWAMQPITARARIIWRNWAAAFARHQRWEQRGDAHLEPRMRAHLDELAALLSGPATRGELRVLDAYEEYFQTLFTLGWALASRVDPGEERYRLRSGDGDGRGLRVEIAWQSLVTAWSGPWEGRREHANVFAALEACLATREDVVGGASRTRETAGESVQSRR
ncbi:MAG: hypothetical protein FJ033_01755 [Chloroflexi bacterium]|nr:hypothetical protein [Chloroflexota bacterium]